jgi:uncharacterized protein with FMN-binding domain
VRKSITVLLSGLAVAVPAGNTFAAIHETQVTKKKKKVVLKPRTVAGPSVETDEWGPVQVTIIVKGKKITDVQTASPHSKRRSAFINDQAVPLLRQEVLQVQSAQINIISGATQTSDAFGQSLQAAINAAHLPR